MTNVSICHFQIFIQNNFKVESLKTSVTLNVNYSNFHLSCMNMKCRLSASTTSHRQMSWNLQQLSGENKMSQNTVLLTDTSSLLTAPNSHRNKEASNLQTNLHQLHTSFKGVAVVWKKSKHFYIYIYIWYKKNDKRITWRLNYELRQDEQPSSHESTYH